MNDEARNSLSAIRGSLYGYHTALSKSDALKNLERLADKKIPTAMHLLGHALWEVVEDSADVDRAFVLISEAAAMGLPSAMASLGAMYMVGAGCKRSFEEALKWYQRSENAWDGWDEFAPRLGRVGLRDYEFRSSFSLKINDRNLRAPVHVLENLNQWQLALKAAFIDAQLAILSEKKSFGGVTNRWDLPFKGHVGGERLFVFGSEKIEKIGFREDWLGVKSEFWMSWSEFPDAGKPVGLAELTSLAEPFEIDAPRIREAYLAQRDPSRKSSWRKFLQVLGRPFAARNTGEYFELCLNRSPVHHEISLRCAGVEIYSRCE